MSKAAIPEREERSREQQARAALQAGQHKAAVARQNVAHQLYEMVTEANMTGSPSEVVRRLREAGEAQGTGDPDLVRAAAMEVAAAAALWVVELDLARSR